MFCKQWISYQMPRSAASDLSLHCLLKYHCLQNMQPRVLSLQMVNISVGF